MTVNESKPITHQFQDARLEGIRQGKILATTKALAMLIKNLGLSSWDAMVLLEIPKKERKTYTKIFENRDKQKCLREK